MLLRVAKIVLAVALSFTFTFSLWKIIICVHDKYVDELEAVGLWLEENDLGQYRSLFQESGELSLIPSDLTRSHILDTNVKITPHMTSVSSTSPNVCTKHLHK